MQTLINILILDMVLDPILIHFFNSNFDFDQNAIIFDVNSSSSTHANNRKKYILVLGVGPTQRLDDTVKAAEVKHYNNFTESKESFVRINKFLCINGVKVY